jgi:hypothetical protein
MKMGKDKPIESPTKAGIHKQRMGSKAGPTLASENRQLSFLGDNRTKQRRG